MGRPKGSVGRAYGEDIAPKLLKHFKVDSFKEKDGKEVANELPHIIDFLDKEGITPEQFRYWVSNKSYATYGRLKEAWERCKLYREKMIVNNGLKGRYHPLFGMFVAKNVLGWTDKAKVEVEGNSWLGLVKRATSQKLKKPPKVIEMDAEAVTI